MPFLRDEGPPIPAASIQRYRETLPLEYGWASVNETGREVLVVRVPKAKPDYLHDLSEVAFYVGLENVRGARDVLLVGHEKTARLEPQLLRDHIRAQAREDAGVVDHLRRGVDRQYGHTFVRSPSNHVHNAFAVRIPKESVSQFTSDDVNAIRQLVTTLRARIESCQYAYVIANADHERLGRRTLLELVGEAPPPAQIVATAPAPAVATAPVAPTPLPAPPAPAAHLPFPPAPVAAAPFVAPTSAPSFLAAAIAKTPPASATPEGPAMPDAEVADHEEYTIVSRPKATPTPAPEPAAAPTEAAPESAAEEEEYTIVSRAAAAPQAQPDPPREPQPDEGKQILHKHDEYEVFTSKPKPRAEAPAITPPGMGGFQAALHGAATGVGPPPAKTREYEITGRTSVTADPSIASRLRLPGAAPAPAAPFAAAAPPTPAPTAAPALTQTVAVIPPRVSSSPILPTADNGAPFVTRVAPAAPELVLAQRFRDAGYEVVEGLRAQGTTFAFAAHKPNGRRVLVKRSEAFAAEDAAALAQLVAALGADVALVVADHVKPGTRLATWGTRIEVVTPADVPSLGF